ncbi:hypothetical protein R75465_05636 [Paraburkholderia aspalathi]|uniref:hypothetical protein n=1 Tax=Paraburkholderia aspalathi TaxID=1324617 RepID=UPI001B05A17D|nr:hypothetical protein [Paraburkholderia aspalathi]CAE6816639.1 hypothetical protein R75465_05636 [Paraburkholderia aspalathi]
MALNKQVQLFLAVSEAFLKHNGDSMFFVDSREADQIPMTAYAPGEAVREFRDPLQ